MAETNNSKREKVPFGKGFWIRNLVIDSLLFTLNTGATVYATTQYKQGKINPEGDFLIGAAVGMNASAMILGACSITHDIKRICQITKAEKEYGCPVSASECAVLMTHEPNGNVKSVVDVK